MRPGRDLAINDHFVAPYFNTSSMILSSSYNQKNNIDFTFLNHIKNYMNRYTTHRRTLGSNLLGPRTLDKFGIKNFLPSVQTLHF